jgi:hypothetical protein
MRTVHDIIQRVRAEYLEMPGLQLKAEQVQRLCGVDRTICQIVLDSLVESKFLRMKTDGHYTRLTEGYSSHPQAAPAPLRANLYSKKAS